MHIFIIIIIIIIIIIYIYIYTTGREEDKTVVLADEEFNEVEAPRG